jgi:nickel-dependent lactate racemase
MRRFGNIGNMTTISAVSTAQCMTAEQIESVVAQAAEALRPAGRRVLVIIPDHTRSCPLPQVAAMLQQHVGARAAAMDFLIALGTHPPMTEPMIDKLVGVQPGQRAAAFPKSRFFNHDWKNPDALRKIGTLTRSQVREITGGLFEMDVDVTINRMIFDYDAVLICGPVFPHEVVGYSGGAKYFFPGICGEELLNFFHWLGAVITCPKIIGNKWTAVRACLHAAADLVSVEKHALCMVVAGHDLCGLHFGDVKEAWSAAADQSAQVHVKWVDQPYQSVLAQAPAMYDEIWVGAKCMYKMEPVVADGGELIIYAPHISEISVTHGALIEQIGYHTRDYFLSQWDKFKHLPWGVIAHSTHVRGIGTCTGGVECPRVNVTLATGIPESTCRRINLGYRDPKSIRPQDWQNQPGRLYVPKAGEMLYKLRNGPAWQS